MQEKVFPKQITTILIFSKMNIPIMILITYQYMNAHPPTAPAH